MIAENVLRHFRLKEDVARGDGKGAFAMAGSERRSKSQCVEMTAMIRREHKRPVCRQLLAADDRESMCDREVTSQQRKTSVMRKAFEKPAFAPHAAKPLARSQAGVVRWLEVARVPSDLPAAENLLRLADSEADKIIDVVKHSRRDKNQTIEPIENAAVPGNEFRGVLETEVTFDRGKHQDRRIALLC